MNGKLRNMTSIFISKGEKMLLLFRAEGSVVSNMWISSAGGHFEENELNDPRACVLREMEEEISLTENKIENLSLRYVTLRNVNGELRQNYFFFADLRDGVSENISSNEGKSQWFSYREIPDLPMSFSAKQVLLHYFSQGKSDDKLYGGVADGKQIVFVEMAEG